MIKFPPINFCIYIFWHVKVSSAYVASNWWQNTYFLFTSRWQYTRPCGTLCCKIIIKTRILIWNCVHKILLYFFSLCGSSWNIFVGHIFSFFLYLEFPYCCSVCFLPIYMHFPYILWMDFLGCWTCSQWRKKCFCFGCMQDIGWRADRVPFSSSSYPCIQGQFSPSYSFLVSSSCKIN